MQGNSFKKIDRLSFAVGVVAGKYGLTEDEAYSRIQKSSMKLMISMEELANRIINKLEQSTEFN